MNTSEPTSNLIGDLGRFKLVCIKSLNRHLLRIKYRRLSTHPEIF
jgi:hypothetical protein